MTSYLGLQRNTSSDALMPADAAAIPRLRPNLETLEI